MKISQLRNQTMSLCLLLIAALLLITGCGSEPKEPAPAPSPAAPKLTAIHSTYVKSPLNIPSILEKRHKTFEDAFQADGVSFTYSDLNAGPKQTEALAAGEIDICHALGGTSAILAAANGVDLKIVGIYSRAPEAFTILTKDSSIQTIADLKGKTIAGPKGTILHQLLIAALKQAGLSIDDVHFVSMDIPQTAAALASGSADAGLLAGPAALKLQNEGARTLTTGKGLLDATIVIAMRTSFLKNYPDAAKKFLDLHRQVIADYLANPRNAYPDTAAETGLTPEQVETMAKWYDFDPAIRAADIVDLEATQDFLIQTGMLDKAKKIDIKSLCTDL